MPVPDYQTLMLPVLKMFAGGSELRITDCIEQLATQLSLTEEEQNELLPSGKQTVFTNRVHWARTYMGKAGLLAATRRAHFRITERGRQVLREHPNRIDNSVLEQFPEYVEWRNRSLAGRTREKPDRRKTIPESDGRTLTERIESAFSEVQAELRTELLDRVLELKPSMFERLIVDLLVAMGYGGSRADAGRAIGQSGDGGIDGIIKEDPLGLDIVYIQAKRYQPGSNVGRPDVQAFSGSLDGVGATRGVFVTTSTFSSQAREYAGQIAKRLILIDGEELSNLLIHHNVGVRTSEAYEVKKIDEDFFSQE